MGKPIDEKDKQSYRPYGRNCGNCRYRSFAEWKDQFLVIHEKNHKCSIGGFSVKKTAVCNYWRDVNV